MFLLAINISLYISGLLLLGAILILAMYHLFLYVQYKERIILLYSSYLFFLAIYIALYLYAGYRYPDSGDAFIYYAKESANVLAIIFYCLFITEAVATSREDFILLFKALDIVVIIGFIYCGFFLLAGILHLSQYWITNILPPAIRLLLTILAVIAVPLLFPVKADKFIQLIKWGAVIYLVTVLLVLTALFSKSGKVLALDSMQWIFVGTLIDIIIFSIAMGYKIRAVFTKVMEMRNKISQDLHDEVGATLSGIALYSHLAQQQVNDRHDVLAGRSLQTIQQSATEMVNRLSDIVWAVNPKNDNLPGLMSRVQEYALEMATVRNIQVKTDITEKLSVISLPMEYRKNIYLICKESINNAIKYSSCSELLLEVKQGNAEISFTIHDDGEGFSPEKIKRGNGLNNMEQRAAEMNAALSITSKPGKGTVICLKCKIT